MKPNSYANQLRQLRTLEVRQQRDYTAQAMEVYALRQQSIDAMDTTPERKAKLHEDAYRQWTVFMQRDMPANG